MGDPLLIKMKKAVRESHLHLMWGKAAQLKKTFFVTQRLRCSPVLTLRRMNSKGRQTPLRKDGANELFLSWQSSGRKSAAIKMSEKKTSNKFVKPDNGLVFLEP